MFSATLTLRGQEFAPRAQSYVYPYDPNARAVGLAAVAVDGLTIQSTDTVAMRALAAALLDAAKQADRITDLESLRLDAAAARAVNSNRATEPFGTVPSAMPARVTSSTAPEPFDTTDAA